MATNPNLLLPEEELVDYQPMTVPAGGLLATTVGTPMEPLPPIDPATYENDDVVNQLNRITSQDSDYMQLARNAGLTQANKRGLLNSSIAAGASQASAIAAAAPLASQSASQIAARNLERISSHFAGQRQQAQFGHETGMQERQLTAAEEQQIRDIDARLQMQGIDIAAQRTLQQAAHAHATSLAQLNIDAEMERLGRTLTAQEEQQIRDLSSRQALLDMELTSREALTREGYLAELERAQLAETGATARANLDAATRVQLLEMQNLSDAQRSALDYYLRSNDIYARSLDSLYANANMPAPARDAAIQNFLAIRNAGSNLPALVFGTNLTWPTSPTTGGTTGGTGTQIPPPPPSPTGTGGAYYTGPTPDQIRAMFGDGQPGGMEALRAYNTWARANGQQVLIINGSDGTTSGGSGGGFFDTIGRYGGIGLLGSL